jgi:hypothetical protein
MSTDDFIIALFCRVDAVMGTEPKHPHAKLYPSAVVTLALVFALTGVRTRALYRWITRDDRAVFPRLPHRTRLLRLFAAHRAWADSVLAAPTVVGVAARYGSELVHPMREGRSTQQIGRNGTSNQRWIVGITLAYIVNQRGVVVAWDGATANVYDAVLHPVIADCADDMVVCTDMGFYATTGDPPHRNACSRNTWTVRMVIETVVAMLTQVCHVQTISQRRWPYVLARLRLTMALFTLLVQWDGLRVGDGGHVPLTMAQFSV